MSLDVTIVVARAKNGIIGNQGALPWHLPADLKRFKAITVAKPVVMGRKTFESIGKPLPGRQNIVMTRDPAWTADGVTVVPNLAEAVAAAGLDPNGLRGVRGDLMIIGGAEIYQAFLPHTDEVLVTHVLEPHAGDTYLPRFEDEFPHSSLVETHPQFEIRRWTREAP